MNNTNMIEVEGVLRPRLNSNGDPIHSTEQGIINFWKWFGDSKATDDQGRPIVAYHTTNANFTEFKKGVNSGLSGNGIYFSEYPLHQHGAIAMRVYLKIINPINRKTELDGMREINSSGIPVKFIDNVFEMFAQFDGIINRSEMVAKDPNQIKSATDNNGDFNPASSNIYDAESPDILHDEDEIAVVSYGLS
jgi:hypothetical protein